MGLESTNRAVSPPHALPRASDDGADPAALRLLKLAVGLHVVIAAIATIQRLLVGSQINNFLIFRGSFFHLLRGQDLYAAYPLEHFDFYKYSPTWALLFAPFALPPVPVGLVLWNVVNAGLLAMAIMRLLPPRAAAWALGIVFFEALGAIQNAQSNGLAAALMIFALIASEQAKTSAGAFSIAVGTSIKLFPIGAGLFGVLARPRWRHLCWCIVAGAVLLVLPLAVTSFDTLLTQYASWRAISARDTLSVEQAWVGGIVESYLGRAVQHAPFQIAGVVWMLVSSAYASRAWEQPIVRRLLLASLLGFATIFNHKGESPTYVIAFAGIGIWWSVMPRARWRDAIVLAAFVLGSLGGTDLFPRAYRVAYHHAWQLKALTASIAWCAMQWDLWQAIGRPSRSDTRA